MKSELLKQDLYISSSNLSEFRSRYLKHRVYFSVNGEGYGHSSRVLAIARQLDPSEVILGGYGYVLKRFEKTPYKTVEITPEISFVGKNGSLDIGLTILKNSSYPVAINQIIKEEKKIIQNFGVTCVVADSRSAPVFAANKLGIPCILLTNQTTFAPFFEAELNNLEDSLVTKSFKDWLSAGTAAVLSNAAEPFFQKVVKDWLNATDEIFIPDLPPPYSLSLPILCNENFVKKKQRFLGPLLPWSWKSLSQLSHKDFLPDKFQGFKKKIVCTLGGHKYRKPLFEATLNLAAQMPEVLFVILSDFKSDINLPNLFRLGFVDNPAKYYLNADLVITQAGHSTAMELITLGVPMLAVPDTNQVEQESNAKRLCELGVGSMLSYKDLNTNELFTTVQYMLNEESFRHSAKKISNIARKHIAEEEAGRIIKDYSTRVQAY